MKNEQGVAIVGAVTVTSPVLPADDAADKRASLIDKHYHPCVGRSWHYSSLPVVTAILQQLRSTSASA